jgi:hypothetical protein
MSTSRGGNDDATQIEVLSIAAVLVRFEREQHRGTIAARIRPWLSKFAHSEY